MAAPPAPNLGEMALSEHDPMCKCEGCGKIESYAKGEASMTKAMSPVVIARMAANKAKAKAAAAAAPPPAPAPQPTAKSMFDGDEDLDRYAKGEVGMAKTDMPAGSSPTSPDMPKDGPKLPKAKVAAPKSQDGGNDGTAAEKLGKVSNPIVAARLAANKAKAKAAAAAPKEAPKAEPVEKAMNPVVIARMAANKAKAKAAAAAPAPAATPPAPVAKAALNTGAPAPAGAAAATGANPAAAAKPKKNPIAGMKTAVAGMKQAVAKLPGTAAAPKPPKPPALGAGQPTVKAELGKTAISPRDQAAQAAKLPHVRAAAGNLMDSMLASHPAGAQGATIAGVMPGPAAAHKITLPGAHLFGKK
jgi:hypothetical protein